MFVYICRTTSISKERRPGVFRLTVKMGIILKHCVFSFGNYFTKAHGQHLAIEIHNFQICYTSVLQEYIVRFPLQCCGDQFCLNNKVLRNLLRPVAVKTEGKLHELTDSPYIQDLPIKAFVLCSHEALFVASNIQLHVSFQSFL